MSKNDVLHAESNNDSGESIPILQHFFPFLLWDFLRKSNYKLFLTYLSPIFVIFWFITHKSDIFMAFSERLAYARKQKKIKQVDLGKLVGTSGDIIGKYERGENTPSIEVAARIADALGVTLDYLVKDGEYEHIDKLDQGTKTKIFDIIDTYLRDFKTRQAYAR